MLISKKEFIRYLKADSPYVEAFCRSQGVSLWRVDENTEDFPPQGLMYYFTDDLGGYTINAIKGSLEEILDDSNKK